ncbi:MAG: hypothetical protein MI807_19740 [Verrucomicrobiales bacterium]|nr:hypothetical protein [Verrucomicrobiales bacterium]
MFSDSGGVKHWSRITPGATVWLMALAMTGCRTLPEKWGKNKNDEPAEAVQQAEMKVPVGRIHLVSPDGDFVLVKSSRFLPVDPGTGLTVHGSNGVESARLKVSPARKNSFLTADIVSGIPAVGDTVLMDYVAKQPQSGEDPFGGGDDDIQVLE